MDVQEVAIAFKALGDPTRLQIVRILQTACCDIDLGGSCGSLPVTGPTAGEVCCTITGLDQINSTISHHLKELRLAGLIQMERRGRNMVCCLRPERFEELAVFLQGQGNEGVGGSHEDQSGKSKRPGRSGTRAGGLRKGRKETSR